MAVEHWEGLHNMMIMCSQPYNIEHWECMCSQLMAIEHWEGLYIMMIMCSQLMAIEHWEGLHIRDCTL